MAFFHSSISPKTYVALPPGSFCSSTQKMRGQKTDHICAGVLVCYMFQNLYLVEIFFEIRLISNQKGQYSFLLN